MLNLECNTPTYYSNAFSNYNVSDKIAYLGDVFYQENPWTNSDYFRGDPHWSPVDNTGTAAYYCGGTCGSSGYNFRDPFASPYFAGAELLRGLPPLYFVASATETVGGDCQHVANNAARMFVHVVLDLFSGMWHTFPQWSEGNCANGDHGDLWQGVSALQRMGSFVRQVAAAARACPTVFKRGGLAGTQTIVRLLDRGTHEPLVLSLCKQDEVSATFLASLPPWLVWLLASVALLLLCGVTGFLLYRCTGSVRRVPTGDFADPDESEEEENATSE